MVLYIHRKGWICSQVLTTPYIKTERQKSESNDTWYVVYKVYRVQFSRFSCGAKKT